MKLSLDNGKAAGKPDIDAVHCTRDRRLRAGIVTNQQRSYPAAKAGLQARIR